MAVFASIWTEKMLGSCLGLTLAAAINLSPAQARQDSPDPTPPPAPPISPPPASEQPPAPELPEGKELVHAAIKSFGELEAVRKLETVEIHAVLQVPSGEISFNLKSSKDGKFYLVQSMPAQPETIVAFDGKVGWMQNSEMGYQVVDDAAVLEGRTQFNTFFPYWLLMFPDEHFKTYETVERVKFGEHDCYKVRLTPEERQPLKRFGFYDVTEKTVRGMGIEQDTPLGTVTMDFRYDEWKEIDGIKCFTKMTIQQGGQELLLTYNSVEFNKVDRSVYELPDAVKELLQKKQQDETKPAIPPQPQPKPDEDDDDDADDDDPTPSPPPDPNPE